MSIPVKEGYKQMFTTPSQVADVAILAPTGILASVAFWLDAVNDVTGPIMAVVFGIFGIFLLFYRVMIARSKWKIQQQELRRLKHDNDENELT